jgi:type I restriction enzyme, S subunit
VLSWLRREEGLRETPVAILTSRGDFYVNEDDFKHVDLPPNDIATFQLAPGDLLACRFNGNLHYVGRFSYYRGKSGRVQVNPDKLIRFRMQSESNCPRYVCIVMNSAPIREAIEAMCATTDGNIGLSAGRLKTVTIPLPPPHRTTPHRGQGGSTDGIGGRA